MSLMQRVASSGMSTSGSAHRITRMRIALKETLVMRLGYRELARIADDDDQQRSRSELNVALSAILNEEDYASLAPFERQMLMEEVIDDIVGLGPLEAYMHDDTVTEVMVNGTRSMFYEREGQMIAAQRAFDTDEQIRAAIERIIAPLGRRIDEQSPIVNARLKNGYRVNAVIPPVAVDGPLLTIRKFSHGVTSLDELVALNSLPLWYARLLRLAVHARCDIAVVGGTGSGKTTLLNALSTEISHDERIITIEDSAELKFNAHPHVVRLEARDASIEGTGAITIRDLVINALRMRPDRIVVGEVRGGEAIDMLQAMNTGHDGSLTTLHAGSPEEAVLRLVLMARYGIDLPAQIIEGQVATALDLIVMTARIAGGRRVVGGLSAVTRASDGAVKLTSLVDYDDIASTWKLVAEPLFIAQMQRAGGALQKEVDAWKELLP